MKWCDFCGHPIDDTSLANVLELRSPYNGHGFALLDNQGKKPNLHNGCQDDILKVLVSRNG